MKRYHIEGAARLVAIMAVACLAFFAACGEEQVASPGAEDTAVEADTDAGGAGDQGDDSFVSTDGVTDTHVEDTGVDQEPDAPPSESAFRIAVISDPRMVADNYRGSNGNLDTVIGAINAEEGVELTVVLGDLAQHVINPYGFPDPVDSGPWADAFAIATTKLAGFDETHYVVPGDRDYSVSLNMVDDSTVTFADFATRDAVLKTGLGSSYPGTDPFHQFSHGGVNFFAVNTMAGPDALAGNGATGQLGDAQLTALSTALGGAEPVIVLSHHSPNLTIDPDSDGFADVLRTNADNVLAVLHGHRMSFAEYEIGGIKAISVGAVSDNAAYWALVEIDPENGTVRVLNRSELPFEHEVPEERACTPGSGTVAGVDDLDGTYHAVFFEDFTSDDEVVNDLVQELQRIEGHGPLPFALRWIGRVDDNRYEIQVAEAEMYEKFLEEWPEPGDHAIREKSNVAACYTGVWNFEEPCMRFSGPITYDPITGFALESSTAMCGISMDYENDIEIDAQMGVVDGELTIEHAQVYLTVQRDELITALEQYVVDAYCAARCGFMNDMEVWAIHGDNCDKDENGDGDACSAGTLTYADVPRRCDARLGSVAVRTVIELIDMLIESDEVTFTAPGWGHSMVYIENDWNMENMDTNWAMSSQVFTLPESCQE